MHFICTGGCEATSDHQDVCQDPDCADFGMPMHECDCPDGEHGLPVMPDTDEEDAE